MKFLHFWSLVGGITLIMGTSLSAQGAFSVPTNGDQSTSQEQDFSLTGTLGFGAQIANITNAPARFDELDWAFQSQLHLSFKGLTIPFSAYLSDRNRLYNLPAYQLIGMSPTYKWATLHLGDRSLNFNPYTFSNQQFRGLAVELNPKKWRFVAMYGRLSRLQLGDFNARQDLEVSYRRRGWAVEGGYQNEVFGLKAVLFSAEDKLPPEVAPTEIVGLAPARNLVASLEGNLRISKHLQWHTTIAQSFLTEDTRAFTIPDSLSSGLFKGNSSSSTEHAILSTLSFNRPKANWQISYERLSPNYRSLGTLYLTPDRENITAGAAFMLAENKATITVNGGLQRNNLAGNRTLVQRRLIAQVTANFRPTQRFNFNLQLNNFNNTSRVRSFFDPTTSTDSIFIAQVNRSGRIGLSLAKAKGKTPGSWSLNFSTQDAQAIQDEQLTTYRSVLYNTYLAYTGRSSTGSLSYRLQMLYGITESANLGNTLLSPSVGLAYLFDDKRTSLNLTTSYSLVDYESLGSGRVLLTRLNLKLNITERNNFNFRAQYTLRSIDDRPNVAEFILALNFAQNF